MDWDHADREHSWRKRAGPLLVERGGASGGTATASTASPPCSRATSDSALDEELERQREIELCQEMGVLLLPEDDDSVLGGDAYETHLHDAMI